MTGPLSSWLQLWATRTWRASCWTEGPRPIADGDGWTPLHKAACWGHSNVVKLLLNEGAHPNVKGRKEDTPLFLAAKYGRRDVEKILLERGAEPDPKYKDEKMRLTRMYREKVSISRNSASMIDRRGTKQLCGVMSKYRCQRCDFSSNAKTAIICTGKKMV